ncbi:large ribosomal subunit protein bL9m-like [Ptychodera flava]|uniref:large ribosomal subunit protein bL9m-like n=1 Tax=Ptychodera flava TaxID=63121 RepID=UPI003969BB6E
MNGIITAARLQTRQILQLSTALTKQPCRTAVVLERMVPPKLARKGQIPKLKKANKVYKVVKDLKHEPQEKMKLILIQDLEKYGRQGELVTVTKQVGRNKLLAPGLAVYASPENIKEYCMQEKPKVAEEEPRLSRMALKTIEYLKKNDVVIAMRNSIKFQIEKHHVIDYYEHKLGVIVPEHALQLPDTPITKFGEYTIQVTVNGIETVDVKLIVKNYVIKRKKRYLEYLEKMKMSGIIDEPVQETEET